MHHPEGFDKSKPELQKPLRRSAQACVVASLNPICYTQKGRYEIKKIKYVFVILAILAMLTDVAAAPVVPGHSSTALIEVRNDPGGSVTFIFRVEGQLPKSQLKGTVHANGMNAIFPLSCVQKDQHTVHCTASRNAGGKNVVVTFGGASFWTDVPETRPAPVHDEHIYYIPLPF
jgi:hypothetical protein